MKFIVDELPTRRSECPFLSAGDLCKFTGCSCPHFVDNDGCDHLLPIEKARPVVTFNLDGVPLAKEVAEPLQKIMRRADRGNH